MESLFTPLAPARSVSSPPPPTPTTDFVLIESQKENIRPLASGRSAATLSTLFEKDAAADRVVAEGHERFKRDIDDVERRDKEGEEMPEGVQDVLDMYHRYVLFTIQHNPSSPSHLLPLLESTTRRFLNDARYVQDARYLKLWIMYARHVERREEVWAFLESRDVGTRHAVFYEEWAAAAEGLVRKKKADEIYRLGVARKATPVERLKTRHQAFLARIMAPPSGVVPDDDPAPAAIGQTGGRSVLGTVNTTPSSIAGATQLAPANRLSKASNGAKIDIFSDSQGVSEDAATGEWADFGTRDGRRKENVIEAGPWKGETLPQSTARNRVAPRTPKVEVFKDSNDNAAVVVTDELFSRSKQPLSDAELLKHNPLRHYDTSELSTAIPTIPSLPHPPSARKPARPKQPDHQIPAEPRPFVKAPWECPRDGQVIKGQNGKPEKRMFDWNAVFRDSDEWSFEEVRARQRGLWGKDWRGEIKEWERAWHRPGSSSPKEEKQRSMPSPTVNTKLANEEVLRMFDQTIHGSKIRDSDSDSDDDDDDDEDGIVPVQSAPTPLPGRPGPTAMLAATSGMVPPTPTPASGQNRASGSLAIFSDENAVPPSANNSNLNIFSKTPAKTPNATRTPLAAASSSKPGAFGELPESEEAVVASTPAPVRRSLAASNVFATPAVADRVPEHHALASQAIQEEAEDAGEQEDLPQHVMRPSNHVEVNEEEEQEVEPEPRRRGGRFNIHEMTPITERTCEYTHMTTVRSFHTASSGVLSDTQSARRTSLPMSEAEGDEAVIVSDPVGVFGALSLLEEEEDRPFRSRHDDDSPTDSHFGSIDVPLSSSEPSGEFNRSGSVDTGRFGVPEGFTIHGVTTSHHTMVLVDGSTENSRSETPGDVAAVEPVMEEKPQRLHLLNPCNPANETVIESLLQLIDPPLSSLSGFHNHRSTPSNRLESLQKHVKAKVRRASTSSRSSLAAEDNMLLDLGGRNFEIKDKIGEGGFGAVFLACDIAARQMHEDADSDDDDDDEEDMSMLAIKVEKPGCMWESVILDRLRTRLNEVACMSIIQPRNLYAFADESFLLLDFSSQGTLLDVVNKASSWGIAPNTPGAPPAVDELIAMFFTIELLRIIETMHTAGFIHGDLKIDNCLVRLDEIPASEGGGPSWSAQYDPSGGNGWKRKGVKLIDFGRGLDLSLFPAGERQTFIADWKTDERDCVEMREGRAWSFQTDYFGLASVCYCLLHGKYIQTEVALGEGGGRCKLSTPFKRYWQTELWTKLFDTLLNPELVRDDGLLPMTGHLSSIRTEFEGYLADNCQKGGKSLKSFLKKIESAAIFGRRV